ncbi:aminoacyl-tRNA hydrolase [Sinobaca sp. H24]|uniref:aminoacyl-tRNA hydrolase n=1 Tax=Sinobaca sp. H24 TaxID=2923376 RepID=UPI00207A859D|nr:aminoacyl-tRNA hydrolase [Sinobaca sp. H24]
MKIIAGLGNPGKTYDQTRHNIGFDAVDKLAARLGLQWVKNKKLFLSCETIINGEKIILLKPLTYMNLSGEAIAPIMNYFDVSPDELVVLYDDLDLEPGTLRLRQQGGHGGHNGIRSIIDHLGTKEFNRIRIGVGRPDPGVSVVNHVLGRFAPDEKDKVQEAADQAAKAAEAWTSHSFKEVMNTFNQKA